MAYGVLDLVGEAEVKSRWSLAAPEEAVRVAAPTGWASTSEGASVQLPTAVAPAALPRTPAVGHESMATMLVHQQLVQQSLGLWDQAEERNGP